MQIGFFGILGLIFIALKLMGYIAWSWWLVLLPLYGGLAVILILFAIVAMVGAAQHREFKKRFTR